MCRNSSQIQHKFRVTSCTHLRRMKIPRKWFWQRNRMLTQTNGTTDLVYIVTRGKNLQRLILDHKYSPQTQTLRKVYIAIFLQYIWFFTLISQLLSIFIICRVFRFVDNIFLCYIFHLLLLFVQKFFWVVIWSVVPFSSCLWKSDTKNEIHVS